MTDRDWLEAELESGTGDLGLIWRPGAASDRLHSILQDLYREDPYRHYGDATELARALGTIERLEALSAIAAATIESLTESLARCRQGGGT